MKHMANDFAALDEELSSIVQEDFLSWPLVSQGENLSLRERPGCSQEEGFVCLLVTNIVPVVFASMDNFCRPEHLELICREHPDTIVGEVVRVCAPGDCLVRAKVKTCAKVSMMNLMSHSVAYGARPGLDPDTFSYIRAFRRCDFPTPGSTFTLWGTLPADTHQVASDSQSGQVFGSLVSRMSMGQTCMCDVLEPIDNGGRTRANRFTFLPAKHKWMIPSIAKTLCDHIRDGLRFHSIISQQEVEPPYLVLRLKKCSRGPPLLQVSAEDAVRHSGKVMDFNGNTWIQSAVPGSFSFLVFLQNLLRQVGLEDVVGDIYNSMDGRRLVFFQVSIRTRVWREIEPTVADFFSKHSAAYRRWYGGRAAPNLQVGGAPLFLEDLMAPQLMVDPPFPTWPSNDIKWSCKNTFIHFDDTPLVEPEPMNLF